MKKHLLTIAALATSMLLSAQYTQVLPLDYEDFFRADAVAEGGAALERDAYSGTTQGSSGEALKANQWNRGGKDGDDGGENPAIAASTLAFGSYIDNRKGSEIQLAKLSTGTRASIYSLKSNYDYSGQAYYMAALVQISAATGKGDILAFDGNYTANAQRCRLFVNKQGSGYKLGLGWNGDPETWTEELAFGSTHLVVIKIVPCGNVSGTQTESGAVWIDPDLAKPEAENTVFAEVSYTNSSSLFKSVRGITVRQRSNCAGKIAGIRFGASWADVVKEAVSGLPALDAPVVGAASAIGVEEFTANWTAVANAAGYKVKVYAGENMIAEKSIDGQANASVVFYNMPVATELTYTVTAIGDMVNYDNSAASEASAAFSTLVAPASIVLLPSAEQWADYAEEKGAHTAGAFPTMHILGYDFVEAYIETTTEANAVGIENASTGERFTARVVVDKQKNSSNLTMPAVASAARVDIYMNAGSDGKKMEVQQYDYATNKWVKLTELDVNKAFGIYSVTPNAGVVKLRLINPDTSTKYIWKVVTYVSDPANLAVPVLADATDIAADGFTINWAAVANAAGYRVLVYNAEATVVKRLEAEAAAVSLAVEGLEASTEYTVKVAAIGDDAAYVGSALSEAKTVTTIADTGTGVDQLNAAAAMPRKVVVNGQLFIERNGEYFTMTGKKVQ